MSGAPGLWLDRQDRPVVSQTACTDLSGEFCRSKASCVLVEPNILPALCIPVRRTFGLASFGA